MTQLPSIVLVGFKGVGKTTVGKELAKLMYAEFVDTDDMIVELAGKPIGRVWQEDGEEMFNTHEHEAIRRLYVNPQYRVIATGGRAFTHARNIEYLLETGICVWLQTDFGAIWQRVWKELTELHANMKNEGSAEWHYRKSMENREKLYQRAHMRIDTGNNINPTHVALDIYTRVKHLERLNNYEEFSRTGICVLPMLKRYIPHGHIRG